MTARRNQWLSSVMGIAAMTLALLAFQRGSVLLGLVNVVLVVVSAVNWHVAGRLRRRGR
jgi:predicted cobalt transporter CbtA